MPKYTIIRTDTADAQIHKIILDIAEKFGVETALEKLGELEKEFRLLADNPNIGTVPRYMIFRRQEYRVLITEMNLVFYKIDEKQNVIMIYAAVDQRQDYLNIIRGL